MRLALLQPKQNSLYDFDGNHTVKSQNEIMQLIDEMLNQTYELAEKAQNTDLIVTTEAINFPGPLATLPCSYDKFLANTNSIEERFANIAKRKHSWVLADLYTKRDGKYFNEAILFDRSGKVTTRYDKIHLAGEQQIALSRGQEYCIASTDFGKLGISICWDMQFPEVCRHYAVNNVRLVVCPTWGWESIYSHARAYENGIWVAGAMSVPYRGIISGIRTPSEVIAPDGSVAGIASCDRPDVLTVDIDINAMNDIYETRMHDRQPWSYTELVK